MSPPIRPFNVAISDQQLEDLRRRLAHTRWPESETVDDWSQGVPLHKLQSLCDYWLHHYDWRSFEAQFNRHPQFVTEIDGLDIHFLHIRSPHADAMPLLLTHGWPGSVVEFMEVIEPLTRPCEHGGKESDAFHLVIPSLPGYGFSGKPSAAGWGLERIAGAWIELMSRLGYEHYVAQGGDWGSGVTSKIGELQPPQCLGIHLNMALAMPTPEDNADLTERDKKALADMQTYFDNDSGYAVQQKSRPQTVGYGLADSPVGQAAWIYEKFHSWTDNNGAPEDALPVDAMLNNISLYWFTNSAASSARLYWESFSSMNAGPVKLPTAISVFPREIFRPARRWAERKYSNIIHWGEPAKGGHFAAFEQAELFVEELRKCFSGLR